MEFLEYIAKELVLNPDAVKVSRTVDEQGVLLTLEVAQNDMGLIIGRAGETAKALRTLLNIYGKSRKQSIHLKINDPPGVEFVKRPIEELETLL
jgi:predicted RNA-binding protein YlqC (UPF0109 family)